MRIFDMDIDFVNLRSETYTEDSRIPTIHFGTAIEDARRRDFTINSLFYILREDRVEDLTGMGLADLHQRLIRTPLDPVVTFKDDPLRILRAIRFAARYHYDLSPELVHAARVPEIKQALREKVSRERVLKELDGMLSFSPLKTCRPFLALSLMAKLDVFDCVFALPLGTEYQINPLIPQTLLESHIDMPDFSIELWQQRSLSVAYICQVLVASNEGGHPLHPPLLRLRKNLPADELLSDGVSEINETESSNGDRQEWVLSKDLLFTPIQRHNYRLLFQSAALFGLCHLSVLEKRKVIGLPVVSLRDGLKVDNDTAKKATIIFDTWFSFVSLSRRHFSRVEAGLLLRKCQGEWRDCLTLACAFEVATHCRWDPSGVISTGTMEDCIFDHISLDIISRYRKLEDVIEIHYALDNCWLVQPLLDGNEISSLLGMKKGPIIGKMMEEQSRWQLEFPCGTKEEAACYLKNHFDAIEHPVR